MTRFIFVKELDKLNEGVIKMGSILETSIDETIEALSKLDIEKAKRVIDRDDEIDLLEQSIEKDCVNIIAKQQPIASDLRKITSIMKIVTDIERIADHCSDISEYILDLGKKNKINPPKNIDKMLLYTKSMVVDTINCFINIDIEKANSVIVSDDVVDKYFDEISEELINMIGQDVSITSQCVDYLMIIKYIERMADHSTNIAEWIKFIVTGEITVG